MKTLARVQTKRTKRLHPDWSDEQILEHIKALTDSSGPYPDVVSIDDIRELLHPTQEVIVNDRKPWELEPDEIEAAKSKAREETPGASMRTLAVAIDRAIAAAAQKRLVEWLEQVNNAKNTSTVTGAVEAQDLVVDWHEWQPIKAALGVE